MAKVDGFGHISGKLGDQVYYYHKGKTYVRKFTKAKDANTPKQQVQRARMRAVNTFLPSFRDVLRIGYQTSNDKMTPYGEAVQFHLNNALQQVPTQEGETPLFEIIMDKVQLSRGNIAKPIIYSCTRTGQEIDLTWNDALGDVYNRYFDVLMTVAYIPGKKIVYEYNTGTRQSGTGKMTLPADYTEPVYLWVLYHNNEKGTRPNKDHISGSVYLGEL